MRRARLVLVLAGCLLLNLSVACEGASVSSITLCKDVIKPGNIPVDIATRFATDTPVIHAVVLLEDAPRKTTVKGVWVAVAAAGLSNHVIDEVESSAATDELAIEFSISRPHAGWPVGSYRFDLHIEDEHAAAATFEVVDGAHGADRSQAAPAGGSQEAWESETTAPVSSPAGLAGRYRGESGGVTVTLELVQDAEDRVSGSLRDSRGRTFALEGESADGLAMGACYDDDGWFYFHAEPNPGGLLFLLMPADADGEVDYENVQEFHLRRADAAAERGERASAGGVAPGPSPAAETGRAAPAARGGGGPAGDSPLLGAWEFNGTEGLSLVVFVSDEVLYFDGERAGYRREGNTLQVQTQQGPLELPFQVSGPTLTIRVQGGEYAFARLAEEDPAALEGRLCSYSGSASASGSVSSSRRIWFDGRGGFSTRSESSVVSVADPSAQSSTAGSDPSAAVIGTTSGDPDTGSYRLAGDKVLLFFGDGSFDWVRIHHRKSNGQIIELMHGSTVFSGELCD